MLKSNSTVNLRKSKNIKLIAGAKELIIQGRNYNSRKETPK